MLIQPCQYHKLDEGSVNNQVSVTRDEVLLYYTQMQTIRKMETAAGSLYKEKQIRGFCHLYSGQVRCEICYILIYSSIWFQHLLLGFYTG